MNRTKKVKSIDGPSKPKDSKKEISLKGDDDTFVVHHIEEDENKFAHMSPVMEEKVEEKPEEEIIQESKVVKQVPKVGKKIKVKFSNFVQLVANHNYEEVIQKNEDEDVIISSDLIADLANAHEQEEERRIPAIFIIGVVLGIVMTYILLTY